MDADWGLEKGKWKKKVEEKWNSGEAKWNTALEPNSPSPLTPFPKFYLLVLYIRYYSSIYRVDQ